MKKSLFILILLVPLFSLAQKPMSFSDVVETDEVSSDVLFTRANLWFVDNFKNADKVIQFKDKSTGIIKAKPVIAYHGADEYYKGTINYLITLQFKDGRFKYTIEDFFHTGQNINIGTITTHEEAKFKAFGSSKARRNTEWENLQKVVKNEADFIITSLKEEMRKSVKTDDDW